MADQAPRPAPGLAVAIVGHRSNRIEDETRVEERLREILQLVGAPLVERRRLRLVSALAEGADRLAAAAALDGGLVLEAVLPFPPEEYARDFAGEESRAEFYRLIGGADSVLVLDGKPDARELAYEAVGRALLDNCDMLIAVWDGKPGRGRGGTREVIEEAVERQLPIVLVRPDGASSALLRRPSNSADVERLEDLVERPIEEVAALYSPLVGAAAQEKIDRYWLAREGLPRRSWLYGAYPLLLRLVGQGPKKAKGAAADAPQSDPDQLPMARAFAWWDGTAICAAQAFRSAVIVNFALAAFAVLLAVASLLAGKAKWMFVLAEVTTILLLLANAWYAGRKRWQERWLESREIAEMLRVCLMLREVGIGRALAGDGKGRWGADYVRAFARAAPLRSTDLSDPAAASRPLLADIAGQAVWNEATAKRMHRTAHRLERVGDVLFVLVLTAAIAWLALGLVDAGSADRLKYLLTFVTAGFPAVATASYGIRIILDFQGISERAERMAGALRSLLDAWEQAPPSAAALQAFARGAADVLLGDVSAWRLLAEGRRLSIPG
ncbi:MAG TPA: hypothetical protein VF577_01290 [Allosphingosinicella sp.]|jgi:hypothetical protein